MAVEEPERGEWEAQREGGRHQKRREDEEIIRNHHEWYTNLYPMKRVRSKKILMNITVEGKKFINQNCLIIC